MNPYRTREVHPPPPRTEDEPVCLDAADGIEAFHQKHGLHFVSDHLAYLPSRLRLARLEWARKNKCEPWA